MYPLTTRGGETELRGHFVPLLEDRLTIRPKCKPSVNYCPGRTLFAQYVRFLVANLL